MKFFFDIRMSIIPNSSSRQIKINTFSVQYSDEIITKSISRAQEGKFCPWANFFGPFSNRFRVVGGFLPMDVQERKMTTVYSCWRQINKLVTLVVRLIGVCTYVFAIFVFTFFYLIHLAFLDICACATCSSSFWTQVKPYLVHVTSYELSILHKEVNKGRAMIIW